MKRAALVTVAVSIAAIASGLVLKTASSVAAWSLPTLTLALTKNTVTVGGAEVSGAVKIVATVSGEKADAPALILLKPGVTPAELGKAAAALPRDAPLDAIDPYGSFVFDGNATAGVATSAETWLPPGNYVAVNNGNGFTPFTVARSTDPALLPAPDAEIDGIDFAFRGPTALHDGEVVRFKNDGYLIHMFLYAQVKTPADAAKAEALLLANNVPEAKKLYATGVHGQFAGPLSHAELQQEVINQPPGTYILLCAMNAQDGRDHYVLGMFRTITIVK
jgi:hypothetical protein